MSFFNTVTWGQVTHNVSTKGNPITYQSFSSKEDQLWIKYKNDLKVLTCGQTIDSIIMKNEFSSFGNTRQE